MPLVVRADVAATSDEIGIDSTRFIAAAVLRGHVLAVAAEETIVLPDRTALSKGVEPATLWLIGDS